MTIDRLSPIFTLTPDERARVKTLFDDNPAAMLPAIAAALGQGEMTLDLMQQVCHEVKPCES